MDFLDLIICCLSSEISHSEGRSVVFQLLFCWSPNCNIYIKYTNSYALKTTVVRYNYLWLFYPFNTIYMAPVSLLLMLKIWMNSGSLQVKLLWPHPEQRVLNCFFCIQLHFIYSILYFFFLLELNWWGGVWNMNDLDTLAGIFPPPS